MVSTWALASNAAGNDDGVRRGEAYLPISTEHAGSVLAGELDRIRATGYVPVGPLWVPAVWRHDGLAYRELVRSVADWVLRQPASGEAVYVPKVRAELEPLLELWPHVVALPTSAALSIDDLIRARAYPVHPLGVVLQDTWADGRWCSPAEFFHHDLDHARYKLREDMLTLGLALPDPYVDGSTLDTATGTHRLMLPAARGQVGPALWAAAPMRAALAQRLLGAIAAEPRRNLAEAARWLLFELVHEKSLPLQPVVLQQALATPVHEDKLRAKCEAGFYAADSPAPAVVALLGAARHWLSTRCAKGRG